MDIERSDMGFDELLVLRLQAAGLGEYFRKKDATLRTHTPEVAEWLRNGGGYEALMNGYGVRFIATDSALRAHRVLGLTVRAAVLNDINCRFFSSPKALLAAMEREDSDDLLETPVLAVDSFQDEGECPMTRAEVLRLQDFLVERDDDGLCLMVTTLIGNLNGPDCWWPKITRELVEDLKAFRV